MNDWVSFSAFIRDRTVQHQKLVCPVWVLYREYLSYCQAWGFEPAVAYEFVLWIWAVEGVVIRESGTGRLRRVADGIGMKPGDVTMCRRATG